jgi:hypothetical protein
MLDAGPAAAPAWFAGRADREGAGVAPEVRADVAMLADEQQTGRFTSG